MVCPNCNANNFRKVSMVHGAGVYESRGRWNGFFLGHIDGLFFGRFKGTSQSRLSAMADPPPRLPYGSPITLWLVGFFILIHKIFFLDAEDVMRLIEDFAVCTPETHQRAFAMRSEIHSLGVAEKTRLEHDAKEKAAEGARIQRNALKMTDPKQSKS